MKKLVLALIFALVIVKVASAMVITDVSVPTFTPGSEGTVRITVDNTLNSDAQDVTLTLDLEGIPFIATGGSSDGTDEIQEDDDGGFVYTLKASQDIKPGNYQIPYILEYTDSSNGSKKEVQGSIGVTVNGNIDLSFSVETETPVVGSQGKVTLKIVNRGFADAKFVNVQVYPSGFTLLSSDQSYIGTIDSDDFETAAFDVIFNKEKATFSALVQYKDFENNLKTQNIDLPLTVYTPEKAQELGIIQKSNLPIYIGVVVVLVVLWFVWRAIQKRRRMKRSMMEK